MMEAPAVPAQVQGQNIRNRWMEQEKQLIKFASAFGAKPVQFGAQPESAAPTPASRELLGCFGEPIGDHEVVLTVPSMDMKIDQETSKSSDNPLPRVGQSNSSVVSIDEAESSALNAGSLSSCKPDMAASVLPNAKVGGDANECTAKEKLSKPISWTKSTLSFASSSLASNISTSFASMIDSRLRSWTLVLLKHSLTTGHTDSRGRLMGILSAKVDVESAETTFKTLPLPESAKRKAGGERAVLPLLFESTFNLTLQGMKEKTTLRAPGTLLGQFLPATDETRSQLKKVEIRLDAAILLKAMVEQARLLVFRAVALATKTPVPPTVSSPVSSSAVTSTKGKISSDNAADSNEGPLKRNISLAQGSGLATCRSALNLPSAKIPPKDDQSTRLKKARSSALRLNNVLQGRSTGPSKIDAPKRVRSVRFNDPSIGGGGIMKKPDGAYTVAKLKSFKSFGRPHGSDTDSGPRNATFGDYGSSMRPTWGRDGRMVHHPAPMQKMTGHEFDGIPTPDKNATFDDLKSSRGGALRGGGGGGLERSSAIMGSDSAAVSSNLPRSATVLENWFLKSATR